MAATLSKSSLRWALLMPLLAGLLAGGPAACGGLETFDGVGTLEVAVTADVDPATSWAALYHTDGTPLLDADEHPVWRRLDADGRVRFHGIPAGAWEVLVSTGRGAAAREAVRVYGRRSVRREVAPGAAATVAGTVSLEDPTAGGTTVVGLTLLPPVRGLATEEGRFALPGVPAGCYQIFAEHRGHHRSRAGACVQAGDAAELSFHLVPDTVPLCQACESHADCGEGGRCVLAEYEGAEERVCTRACASDLDCPEGFECEAWEQQQGGLCLPDAASCAALQAYQDGAACTTDADCGLAGEAEDIRCSNGSCTLSCSDDTDCLGGRCGESGEEESVCLK